ncbi:MAG: transcription antitermination factor NusB [Pseudomonadota bacterium]
MGVAPGKPAPPTTRNRRPQHQAKAASPEGLTARRAALMALSRILDDRVTIDEALDGLLQKPAFDGLDARDRRFVRALLTTVFRHFGAIDQRLSRFLKRRLPAKAEPVRNILRLGLAQLDHMQVADHAAVSLTVDLARTDPVATHFVPLVNGVLRSAGRDAGTGPGRARTVPAWLWRRWRGVYGEEVARKIIATLSESPELDISVKQDPERWADRLNGLVLPTGTVRLTDKSAVETLDGFDGGGWWVQDAAAALPARLLGPVEGLSVLDLCAAPGGKTAQLAAAGARVIAVDQSARRLERLRGNLARLQVDADIVQADILTWEPAAPADAILLDAPCSATGTIRRHPEIPLTRTETDILDLVPRQADLLRRAAAWTRRGGLLVYSTCSLEPEEGEDQAAGFLDANPDFVREPITAEEVGGLDAAITPSGDVRTLPFMNWAGIERRGLDGFFMARFRRTADRSE